ncbi:condensation domain-containing protein [Massilia sp. MB5]|uniref:condensation domain-containing protein n=1 Tax=Massilia sp. MB5 TaxID=2919578 RepID=UPI0021A436C5|nr:condensation domain-containing protein [Massilia sp. MB5]
MNTVQFLNQLKGRGIHLWLEEDRLRFRAPPQALSEDLKAELARRKPELLALLRQSRAEEGPELGRMERVEPIPLTFGQQRLWFLDQLQPGVPAYNVYDCIEIPHALDVPALRRAVDEVLRRHEVLRTTFPAVDGIPQQQIHPPAPLDWPLLDLSALPAAEREQEALRLAAEESATPFNLAKDLPLRIKLLRLAPERYLWLLSIHHIASDDWSKKLLNQELEALEVRPIAPASPRHCPNCRCNGPISPSGSSVG